MLHHRRVAGRSETDRVQLRRDAVGSLLNRFQAYAPLPDSLRERLLTLGPRCSAGLLDRYLRESVRYYPMSKPGISFTRRAPDNITEELVAVLSSKASFEFKPLFDIILLNLRERNAASGGEEMLRLRSYEKLQGLVSQGAVTRTVKGITKKYKGVAPRMVTLRAEMKVLRSDWAQKLRAKAAAAT